MLGSEICRYVDGRGRKGRRESGFKLTSELAARSSRDGAEVGRAVVRALFNNAFSISLVIMRDDASAAEVC